MSDAVRIDSEFQNRLPPLTNEERQHLRDGIIEEGGIRDAIIYWDGKDAIVDGHNRFDLYNELIEEGHDIRAPRYVAKKFDDREAVLNFIDENAIGKRNLSGSDKSLVIGRIYNYQKKRHGEHKGNQYTMEGGQLDHLPSEKTSDKVAKQFGVGSKTVRRHGQRAEVYDTIVAERGSGSDEAKAAKSVPQEVIERVLSATAKGEPMSEAMVKEKAKADRKKKQQRKKRAKAGNITTDLYSPAPRASFAEMVARVKDKGPLKADEFWGLIGAETTRKWFQRYIRDVHYLHILENKEDGTCELFVDETERDLCTAVHKQIERMREWSTRQNRFKFDIDMYKKTIQDLYDLVNKASTLK